MTDRLDPDTKPENGRGPRGRFAPGNAGGPGGVRRHAAELRRAAEDALTPELVAAMMRKAARMALEGNLAAMRFVLERTCGRAAEAPTAVEPLGIQLPQLRTAADCNAAIERMIEGICRGTVDRDAARLLVEAIVARVKTIEVSELETRLAQLEFSASINRR